MKFLTAILPTTLLPYTTTMTNRESVGVDTEDGLYMASDNNNVPETQKNHTVMVFIGVVVISIFIGLIISFILIEGGYVG